MIGGARAGSSSRAEAVWFLRRVKKAWADDQLEDSECKERRGRPRQQHCKKRPLNSNNKKKNRGRRWRQVHERSRRSAAYKQDDAAAIFHVAKPLGSCTDNCLVSAWGLRKKGARGG